jgi:hypothetical protein
LLLLSCPVLIWVVELICLKCGIRLRTLHSQWIQPFTSSSLCGIHIAPSCSLFFNWFDGIPNLDLKIDPIPITVSGLGHFIVEF